MTKSSKPQSKSAMVTRMLSRDRGASVAELKKATGWKEHSVRAFLTGVRKKAELIKKERGDGTTSYCLAPALATADAPRREVRETGE